MNIETYQKAAARTCPDLGSLEVNLAHMALGVSSELSELVECLAYEHIDTTNLAEELGDKMWYAVNWANFLNLNVVVPNTDYKDSVINNLIIYGGQLADISKRLLAYKTPLEVQEEKRLSKGGISNTEILNLYIKSIFELAGIYELDMETIMGKNITKLYIRYPDKFSEDKALIRDLEAERKALEL